MCETVEKFARNYAREYAEECAKESAKNERVSAIERMIRKGFDKEVILSLDYSEEEIKKAESAMLIQA